MINIDWYTETYPSKKGLYPKHIGKQPHPPPQKKYFRGGGASLPLSHRCVPDLFTYRYVFYGEKGCIILGIPGI